MIIFKKCVVEYLDDLIFNLYDNDYFGFIENSEDYVKKIIDFIEYNIHNFPSKKTSIEIQNLGSNYIFYKSNQRTTWYIFFEQNENNYLITNILNNYSEEIKWL